MGIRYIFNDMDYRPKRSSFFSSVMAPAILLVILFSFTSVDAEARRPRAKYVILVSMDGFRYDYPDLYDAPNIQSMKATGVWGTMQPSYPASTFPNHYALATGLVPDHNGLVNNSFWDPELKLFYSSGGEQKFNPVFFLGEPIWNTASRQGILSGVHYWVGSDVKVGGHYPRYYKTYGDNMLSYEERTDSTLALMKKPKKDRPRLLMLYFDEPDHTGHASGPVSPETAEQVSRVDSMVGRLREGIRNMGLENKVDLIVLSDHGMTEISPDRIVNPYDYMKQEWCEDIVFGTPTSIFSKNAATRDSIYNALQDAPHVHVWKKEDIPAELNYGTSPRIGDIVVAPHLGWQFGDRPSSNKGRHGYSPFDSEMQTVFRAEGPDFKKGYKTPIFRNVSIYPLVCYLLGIVPAPNDGDLEEVRGMLR